MMLYDVYYADGTMDNNVARISRTLKSAVVKNTNGGEGTTIFDRYGKEWDGSESIPFTRLTTAGRAMAEKWGFRISKDASAAALGRKGGAAKSAAKAKSSAANGAKGGRPRGVVTWQAPNGETIDICKHCESALFGNWPRNSRGEEYCSVSYGLHSGTCQICNPTE